MNYHKYATVKFLEEHGIQHFHWQTIYQNLIKLKIKELALKILSKHDSTIKCIIMYLWNSVSYRMVVFSLVWSDDFRSVFIQIIKRFKINYMFFKLQLLDQNNLFLVKIKVFLTKQFLFIYFPVSLLSPVTFLLFRSFKK